jgi:hypothetical protein
VTSFYGLDVARAVRGGIPDVERLERAAEAAVRARLAWPAPVAATAAIDDAEHDLATLGALLEPAAAGSRRGAAQYLLQLNPHLGRALRTRWMRWHRGPWTAYDGLVAPGPPGRAALAAHRLAAREYSVSALQHFAACPYRFYLSAVLRLAPRPAVTRPEQLDPLTRGRLFHRVQAATLRALAAAALLPLAETELASGTTPSAPCAPTCAPGCATSSPRVAPGRRTTSSSASACPATPTSIPPAGRRRSPCPAAPTCAAPSTSSNAAPTAPPGASPTTRPAPITPARAW